MTQAYDQCLAPTGLSTSQFSILATLARSGPRGIGDLAEELVMDRTTMSRAVQPLERDGLVQIRPDPEDRRSRQLHLTPRGRTILADAQPRWAEAQARLHQAYGEDKAHALLRLLDTLVASDLRPAGSA